MALEALAERGRGLRDVSRAEWPFAAAKLAEALEAELSNPTTLMTVAGRLCHLAQDLDVDTVVGASDVGERLAGAVAASANGRLQLWSESANRAHTPRRLMVVAGVINTGTELARKLGEVRSAGVADAVGAAVIGNRSAIEAWRAVGHNLVALEEI